MKTRLSWIGWLFLISLVINHMVDIDHFPFSDTYHFPLQNILDSFVRCLAVVAIAEVSFMWHSKNYFQHPASLAQFLRFLITTLLIVTVVYALVYLIMNGVFGEQRALYNIVRDYGVTILVSALIITTFFMKIYFDLFLQEKYETSTPLADPSDATYPDGATHKTAHQPISTVSPLIEDYSDIAYFYSHGKVVFLVKTDGSNLPTDHVLVKLEPEAQQQQFFRANRQVLLNESAIDRIEKIENGKLSVFLYPTLSRKEVSKIIVSRYKRKDFLEWYNKSF